MPSLVRPERPERWFADACEIGLDRQPLHLRPHRVAADARRAGVDDVADARHGEARLGDVRREHDAASQPRDLRRLEHPVLVGRGEPAVEGEHLGLAGAAAPRRVRAHRRLGVADLALAREEHEHVAG